MKAKRNLMNFSHHSIIPVFHFSGGHPVNPVIPSKNCCLCRGFTLLEVMVSMVLIATALLAIFRLQAQNLDIQSESQFMTMARLLAQERLSRIAGNPEEFSEGRSDGDFGQYYPEYRYTQEIRRTAANGNLYHVSVGIFDDEKRTLERSFSIETFMFKPQ